MEISPDPMDEPTASHSSSKLRSLEDELDFRAKTFDSAIDKTSKFVRHLHPHLHLAGDFRQRYIYYSFNFLIQYINFLSSYMYHIKINNNV